MENWQVHCRSRKVIALKSPDWKTKDKDLMKEMLRHGEARLAAQLQLATSADQRATALAGIYVAVATGIIGAIAGSAFKGNAPLLASASVAALAFLIAAILCVLATLPVGFCTPGNDPESWYDDIDAGKSMEQALGEQAEHFNAHILENRKVIKRNSRFFQVGALLGISAPVIGILVAGFICLLAKA